jgi:transcriptional regulator with XRE-family HTH domain
MFLRDLLRDKGIRTPSELGRRLGISKQHAWLLWHGKVLPSTEMLGRFRERLQIPLDELADLEREAPPKRRGPRPKHPPNQDGV